jgi:hypothetical protein
MGRPKNLADADLADRLRRFMRERSWTGSDVAVALLVHKSTISRALDRGTFSPALRPHVASLIAGGDGEDVGNLLQESLRILAVSDRLKLDAEAMIARALDLARQNQ